MVLQAAVSAALQDVSTEVKRVLEADNPGVAKQAVQSGLGVALGAHEVRAAFRRHQLSQSDALFFASQGLGVRSIGVLASTYPAVWGLSQLATGALSDRWGRKWMIVFGMWTQAVAIFLIAATPSLVNTLTERFWLWMIGAILLGLGTALVYPTLLAAIGDVVEPVWRAAAVGVYRLWRDLGYAINALISGILADNFGLVWAYLLWR